jgi:hypothetical protein
VSKDLHLVPSPSAVAQALNSLEDACGGRQAMVAQLLHAPETPEQRYVLGLLADPRSDALHLARICERGKVSLGQLINLLKEAKASKALLESMDRIARFLPEVAEDVMARSVPHDQDCGVCWGRGRVKVLDEKRKPTGQEAECAECDGRGKVRVLPPLDRQKVALELGGLLKRGGVVVNVNQQQNNAAFLFGPDARKDFRSATDALLYRRGEVQGEHEPGAGAGVVDAERADGDAGTDVEDV